MAKKQGRDLVQESIQDAKAIRDLAQARAQAAVVDHMAPAVRALVERTIRSNIRGESVDRSSEQGSDYYSPGSRERSRSFEENKDKDGAMPKNDTAEKELDLESLAGMFPGLTEEDEPEKEPEAAPGEADPMEALNIPQLGEGDELDGEELPEAKAKEEKPEDEIEISEAELRKVYEAALQVEAQVKKGFSELSGGGELEQAAKDTGIADKKNGESQWDTEKPPKAQDWMVKEHIARGVAENKMLRAKLVESVGVIRRLVGTLHETNLFNAKVLYTNRILNAYPRMTREQREVVLESIDGAKSIVQAKMVAETIRRSFKASSAATLAEGRGPRKPVANAQRARRTGTPEPRVLRESADRAQGAEKYSRLQQLAGLVS